MDVFTCVSMCAGYDGIGLGIKRVVPNLRTVCYVEIEAFAICNLVAKIKAGLLDDSPIWSDLKTFDGTPWTGKVDLLTAGYPCQPFSAAGNRGGSDDPRHLWPYIREHVRTMRPRYCFFENVEGHITLGLSTVLSDLEEDGFTCTWGIFSAAEVGAPHQRKRVFILAESRCQRDERRGISGILGDSETEESGEARQRQRYGNTAGDAGEAGTTVGVGLADANGAQRGQTAEGRYEPNGHESGWHQAAGAPELFCEVGVGQANSDFAGSQGWDREIVPERAGEFTAGPSSAWPARPGERQYEWEPPRTVANTVRPHKEKRLTTRREAQGGGPYSEPGRSGGAQGMADADSRLRGELARPDQRGLPQADGECGRECGKIEPALGRDIDGTPDWVDLAELYQTCSNRVDELRLLGNGVVPDCAAKAFRTLWTELMDKDTAL